MKTQKAQLNYLRIAPRKVRLAVNLIKGLSVNEAEAQLLMSPKRASQLLLKLLRSAVVNAKHNQQIDSNRLFIKEIRVDKGPMLKRHLPRAMGRATMVQKKSSHIILVLAESDKPKPSRFRIIKPEKISKKEKAEKIKKKIRVEKPKIPEPEKEKTKATEKLSFIKRIFRRKTI